MGGGGGWGGGGGGGGNALDVVIGFALERNYTKTNVHYPHSVKVRSI